MTTITIGHLQAEIKALIPFPLLRSTMKKVIQILEWMTFLCKNLSEGVFLKAHLEEGLGQSG